VPLELARMEATHLTSMACKVSATDCSFFLFFFLGYREDVHSMQAARPTKIPDEPMLCETPALSR